MKSNLRLDIFHNLLKFMDPAVLLSKLKQIFDNSTEISNMAY